MRQEQDDLQGGLGEGAAYQGRFMHISGGKVVERVGADTPGAISRVLSKGKNAGSTIWESKYDNITGRIMSLTVREREVDYGAGAEMRYSTVLIIKAGDETINLELDENGRYWPAFMFALPNIDLARSVRLKPYDYIPKGKEKASVGMSVCQAPTTAQKADPATKFDQDGTVKVPWYWSMAKQPDGSYIYTLADGKPSKMPAAEKWFNRKENKDDFDFKARDLYLRGIATHFSEKLRKSHEDDMADLEAAGATSPAPQKTTPVTAVDAAAQTAAARTTQSAADPFPVQTPIGHDEESDLPF